MSAVASGSLSTDKIVSYYLLCKHCVHKHVHDMTVHVYTCACTCLKSGTNKIDTLTIEAKRQG